MASSSITNAAHRLRVDAPQTEPQAKSSAVSVKKKELKGSDFSISWTCKTELIDYRAGGEDIYVHFFVGTLQYQKSENDEPKNAGCIKAYKINLHTFDCEDFYEHLDAMSRDLKLVALLIKKLQGDEDDPNNEIDNNPYGQAIIERMGRTDVRGYDLVNEAGEADEIIGGDVLYIDHIEVKEEFRGFNLGLFLLDRADNTLNGPMSLCLLIPYPLQHLERHGEAWKQAEFEADREKIIKHYKRLGFKKIQYGPKTFLGRWNGYVNPSLKSVCPELFA